MKISANSLKVGMVIYHKDKLWKVVKTQHTQPGKGGAYVQAELKCVTDGTKLNERFRSSETIERAILEERKFSYLYNDGAGYVFMDQETFDQITLTDNNLTETEIKLLNENMEVSISLYQEQPLFITLPKTVTVEVLDTEVEIKGQTVTASYKPATVTNGLRVMVPPHIGVGTNIIINTEDLTYSGKLK